MSGQVGSELSRGGGTRIGRELMRRVELTVAVSGEGRNAAVSSGASAPCAAGAGARPDRRDAVANVAGRKRRVSAGIVEIVVRGIRRRRRRHPGCRHGVPPTGIVLLLHESRSVAVAKTFLLLLMVSIVSSSRLLLLMLRRRLAASFAAAAAAATAAGSRSAGVRGVRIFRHGRSTGTSGVSFSVESLILKNP